MTIDLSSVTPLLNEGYPPKLLASLAWTQNWCRFQAGKKNDTATPNKAAIILFKSYFPRRTSSILYLLIEGYPSSGLRTQ